MNGRKQTAEDLPQKRFPDGVFSVFNFILMAGVSPVCFKTPDAASDLFYHCSVESRKP